MASQIALRFATQTLRSMASHIALCFATTLRTHQRLGSASAAGGPTWLGAEDVKGEITHRRLSAGELAKM